MRKIFLFGGTFDPPHLGHIALIEKVYNTFLPDIFYIIPSKKALIKPDASASKEQRYAMLTLAMASLAHIPAIQISRVQMDILNSPYAVDLLHHMRSNYPDDSISFILGMDAFQRLFSWHRWHELLSLAHLMIVDRKSIEPIKDKALLAYHNKHYDTNISTLSLSKSGHIFHFQTELPEVASASIRAAIQRGEEASDWSSESVLAFIQKEGLYTRGR